MKSLSRVRLFAIPCTVAHQAPLSMGFSRQEYWSGLPFPSPGDLPHPGIKPRSPTLQADALSSRLQQYMNRELPDVQAGFRKGRGIRDQIVNICWLIEKVREFQKKIYFCLLTIPKPLIVWITTNCGKFLKRWEYQTTWPAPEKSVCKSRSNS